ncbi:MAG: UDP-3-O-(3-hydroxymyristoyl)glucosamine N-acyltransferase [Pseudomonadota bacterium]|nr:UDP-3-O-(3-hydroxymyristoyl)glucosamine N-acyltransferase [Pseudomonadota bacterium]
MTGRTVAELAASVGGTVEGDATRAIRGVRGLEDAGPEDVSFLANRRYARRMAETRAGCVLVGPKDKAHDRTVIRCADPYLAFAQVLRVFVPEARPAAGVHPMAVVEGSAEGATVMAFAYVGPGAMVGEGSVLYPGAYVGAGASVGRGCTLMAGSVVADGCQLGDRVWLNPGVVVGGEGFGFVPTASGHVKIPQTGRAVIGDDVEIGANSCVDRAAMGETVVQRGAKLDNLVQIGHGATVGPDCLLVSYAGVAGSTRLGRGVVLAARAGVLGHLDVGDGVVLGADALLTEDAAAGERRSGVPAIDHRRWLRVAASLPELPELLVTVRRLEAEIARLKLAAPEPAALKEKE